MAEQNLSIAKRVAQTLSDSPATPKTLPGMLPLIYHELRIVGRSLLSRERPGHTLQPTAVINEAYMRLAGVNPEIQDKAHCFRLLAQAMRRVLIDHGRGKRREKREQPTPDEVELLTTMPFKPGATPLDAYDVGVALTELAKMSAPTAEMVQLRYFFGLEDAEIAVLLSTSEASVTRGLRMAKAWLTNYVKSMESTPEPAVEMSPGM